MTPAAQRARQEESRQRAEEQERLLREWQQARERLAGLGYPVRGSGTEILLTSVPGTTSTSGLESAATYGGAS